MYSLFSHRSNFTNILIFWSVAPNKPLASRLSDSRLLSRVNNRFPTWKMELTSHSIPKYDTPCWLAPTNTPDGIDWLTEKSSRFHALLQVVAYANRFVKNCRRPRPNRDVRLLVANETQFDLFELIRLAQSSPNQEEINNLKKRGRIDPSSSLVKLTPYLDQRGNLCFAENLGGRIENAL